MKHLYKSCFILLISFLCVDSPAQSPNRNYIRSRTYTNAAGTTYQDQIDYFDGFGRPEQSVQRNATPGNNGDIVTLQEYDAVGRESNQWNPVSIASNSGKYVTAVTFKNKATALYKDSRPYAMPVYEASHLNRIKEQYGPGQNWHNNSRSVKTSYLTNIAGNDTLNCIYYTISNTTNDTVLTLKRVKNYATSQLFVTRMQSEDGYVSFEFKDKQGQVILTRNILYNGKAKSTLDTYYIYDDFGNLVAVLPPEASDVFKSGSATT